MGGSAAELIELAIAAHGGHELWDGAREISARVSSGGLAFASKLQGSAVRDVEARVSTRGQHVIFTPYPRSGRRGVLDADGSVRIETDAGEIVQRREHARSAFADLRHKLWWDRLDILYFGTYAIWTYITAPFVFAREGFSARELDAWDEGAGRWRRLAVSFPAGVHTHSREQVFYFDERGLVRRLDYTAEVFNSRAHAAHYCYDHREMAGLIVPTRRRVHPRRRNGTPRRAITLVAIEVESVTAS